MGGKIARLELTYQSSIISADGCWPILQYQTNFCWDKNLQARFSSLIIVTFKYKTIYFHTSLRIVNQAARRPLGGIKNALGAQKIPSPSGKDVRIPYFQG